MGDLVAMNDLLTAELSDQGWNAETEEDFERLNDLTHRVHSLLSDLLGDFVREEEA